MNQRNISGEMDITHLRAKPDRIFFTLSLSFFDIGYENPKTCLKSNLETFIIFVFLDAVPSLEEVFVTDSVTALTG